MKPDIHRTKKSIKRDSKNERKLPLRDPAEGASFASYRPSILLTGIRITVFSRDTAVRRGSFR